MEDWSERELFSVMETTDVVFAVTQAWDNEVSGSRLNFAINLVLFVISLANLEDIHDRVIKFLGERL